MEITISMAPEEFEELMHMISNSQHPQYSQIDALNRRMDNAEEALTAIAKTFEKKSKKK